MPFRVLSVYSAQSHRTDSENRLTKQNIRNDTELQKGCNETHVKSVYTFSTMVIQHRVMEFHSGKEGILKKESKM